MDFKEKIINETIQNKGYVTAEDISQIYGLSFEGAKLKLSQLMRLNILKRVEGYQMPFRFTFSDLTSSNSSTMISAY